MMKKMQQEERIWKIKKEIEKINKGKKMKKN